MKYLITCVDQDHTKHDVAKADSPGDAYEIWNMLKNKRQSWREVSMHKGHTRLYHHENPSPLIIKTVSK